MADIPVTHTDEPTPIPIRLRIGPADCHTTEGVTLWERDGRRLRLCYHCTKRHRTTIADKGWKLVRENAEHLGL